MAGIGKVSVFSLYRFWSNHRVCHGEKKAASGTETLPHKWIPVLGGKALASGGLIIIFPNPVSQRGFKKYIDASIENCIGV